MPSFREAYFETINLNVPKSIVLFAMQEISGLDNLKLTNNFDTEFQKYPSFIEAIKRYLKGEMMEYILNKASFCGDIFYVDNNVLIPRQETEQLVYKTIDYIDLYFKDKQIAVADVCTGSGCIGISIAKRLPKNNYFLSDISKDAIRVANKNIKTLLNDVKIQTVIGDMLEPLKDFKFDVIICNPPYISDISMIDKKTWDQEPHLALLANPSTKYYEEILNNYKQFTNKHSLLAFEIGEDMEKPLIDLIKKYCPKAFYSFEKDLYGKTRFLFIKQQ